MPLSCTQAQQKLQALKMLKISFDLSVAKFAASGKKEDADHATQIKEIFDEATKELKESLKHFISDEKALSEIQKLLDIGADEGRVAIGLAGVDSPEAWAMRERLLKEGAHKNFVAQGLAGVDSPKAWAMRERLLKEEADKGSVAIGLAGIVSP